MIFSIQHRIFYGDIDQLDDMPIKYGETKILWGTRNSMLFFARKLCGSKRSQKKGSDATSDLIQPFFLQSYLVLFAKEQATIKQYSVYSRYIHMMLMMLTCLNPFFFRVNQNHTKLANLLGNQGIGVF